MAITIRQIAAAAGVSRGTVDRVLHNRQGVKPEVAEHVRKIAKDLGFLPNKAGKILAARKQPLCVGCCVPSTGNDFFNDIVKGFKNAKEELQDFGVDIIVNYAEGYGTESHVNAIEDLVAKGCNALCLSTVDTPETRNVVNKISDSKIPVITVNTDLTYTNRLCYVGPDYYSGGATAAGLVALLRLEYTSLLIVTGSLHIKGHNDRIRGFSRTLRQRGLEYTLTDIFESQDNDQYAYENTLRTLKRHPDTNCIYIVAGGVTGTCKAVVELGLEEKIYIVSHDDVGATKQLLCDGVIDFTICQDPVLQGHKAIRILFDYFLENKSEIPETFISETTIKVKENI